MNNDKKEREIVLQLQGLNIAFDSENGEELQILHDINFNVRKGEFVMLCGSSGSGKSTLANCLNGIIPNLLNASYGGRVLVNGLNASECKMHELSSEIGLVFQNPEDQIFSIRVCDELAFGVECQGYPHDEIVRRVHYAMDKLRIREIEKAITFTLSGGQKQKLSIASNLAVLPSIIVLDDPTTDLDPLSKKELMDILLELKREVDTSFIVIEHDLSDLCEFADRMLVMHEGRLVFDGRPEDIFYDHYDELLEIGVRVPDQIKIARLLHSFGLLPANLRPLKTGQVEEILRQLVIEGRISFRTPPARPAKNGRPVVRVDHLSFNYPGRDEPTLKDISFEVKEGELFGIVGHNGSGKSTLMQNILGIFKPTKGDVWLGDKNSKELEIEELIKDIGYCFQNPDNQLFCNSVREEIEFGMRKNGLAEAEIQSETERALNIVGLKAKEKSHPFALSRGERQRLAVATMLVEHPRIIMLDEPTTGLDESNLANLLALMEDIIKNYGGTLIMVTHDMEVVSNYVDHLVVVDHGELKLEGDSYTVFSENFATLNDLKLKPTAIGAISSRLKDLSVAYMPHWKCFCESLIIHEGECSKK